MINNYQTNHFQKGTLTQTQPKIYTPPRSLDTLKLAGANRFKFSPESLPTSLFSSFSTQSLDLKSVQVFSLVRTSPLAALRCWLLPLFAPQPSIPSCLWSPDERFCSHQHFIKHKLRLKSEPWNNWCEYELRIFSCFHLCSLINFCHRGHSKKSTQKFGFV